MIGYDGFRGEEQPRLRAAGPARRHRRRLLRRGHRHRTLRGRPGAGAGERQGQRRDRHRHAGAGALHRASPRSPPSSSASRSRDVDVVTGDTDQFYWGAGTFASRGAVVAGNAVNEAAKAVREKILKLAAEHFECAEEDLELADGEVSVVGVPGKSIKLGELAQQGQSDARRGQARHRAGPRSRRRYFGPPTRRHRERRATP